MERLPANYREAAYLLRKSFAYANAQIDLIEKLERNLKELSSSIQLNHPDYLFVKYHCAMVDWEHKSSLDEFNRIIKNDPAETIKLLAEDDLLSEEKKIKLLEALPLSFLGNISTEDIPSLNLFGNYWLKQARQFLQTKERSKAIWAFQNVPPRSKYYAEACYAIAMHHAHETQNTNHLDERSAFEYARPYVQQGVDLDDESSKQFFDLVLSRLTPVLNAKQRLEIAIKILPLAVQQVLISRQAEAEQIKKTSGVVTKIFSYASTFFSSGKEEGLQQQAVVLRNKWLNLLNESDIDLLQFANDFLDEIKEIKNSFSPTCTNTLQSLFDLENQLKDVVVKLDLEFKNNPSINVLRK